MSKNIADMIFAVAFVNISGTLSKLYTDKILTEKQFSLVVAGQADTIRQMYLAGLAPEQKEEKPLEVQVSEGLKSDEEKYKEQYIKSTFAEEVFDIWNDDSAPRSRNREEVVAKLNQLAKEHYPEWPESLVTMLTNWEEETGNYFG